MSYSGIFHPGFLAGYPLNRICQTRQVNAVQAFACMVQTVFFVSELIRKTGNRFSKFGRGNGKNAALAE